MQKNQNKKVNNHGNTFVVIMVTIACMGILIGVILASIGYYYQMCRMELDDKNNFYYLEQAMDEIYTGVGKDSMKHLMQAYSDTLEVMVRYEDGKYVTVNETEANEIMKQKFLYQMANDENYKVQANLYDNLKSFIATPGVELMKNDTAVSGQPRLYMEILTKVVDGKTVYDGIIIHNITVTRETEGFIQSITTDIEITEPGFEVSFSNAQNIDNALFEFSMVADRGVEFNIPASADPTVDQTILINGNVYAAADNYNKWYSNASAVSSHYNDASYDGIRDSSRYSGIYNNGSRVSISADKVIVPGSISVINDGSLSIYGLTVDGDGKKYADIWADNIVMTPSSERRAGTVVGNGSLTVWANAYIADDMEINSDDATVDMTGNYYGYNYSAQTDEARRALSYYLTTGDTDGDVTNAKRHFGSSAIIVNGNSANMTLNLDRLYVAGRAYIETTRQKNVEVVTDATGTYARTYYTEAKNNTDIQTGESITIKSNQIAYIPVEVNDGVPVFTTVTVANERIVEKLQQWVGVKADGTYQYVVENTISGHTYYFLNFKGPDESAAFINWYVNELPRESYMVATDATVADLTSYADFELESIDLGNATKVTTSGAYTTGALNVAPDRTIEISARSETIVDPDDLFGEGYNDTASIFNFNKISKEYNATYSQMQYALEPVNLNRYPDGTEERILLEQVLNDINNSGIVTVEGSEGANTITNRNNLTPLNRFLNMAEIPALTQNMKLLINDSYDEDSAPQVWLSSGDITITGNGKLSGLIIAKGDVTFGSNVTEFEGLIITGSKLKVDHKMTFVSNQQLIINILEYVEDHPDECKSLKLDKIFKDFELATQNDSDDDDSVDRIEVGDILQYNNWKKNVEE